MDYPLFVTTLSGMSGFIGDSDGDRFKAEFNYPKAVYLDPRNSSLLYVADKKNHCIRKIDTNTGFTVTIAGICGYSGFKNGPSLQARFDNVEGIGVDLEGSVIVADSGNFVLRKVTLQGQVTTFSGSGTQGFKDGVSQIAQYYFPCGMDLDKATGNFIVADGSAGNRVRLVYPNGTVTTIAGTGQTGSYDGPALESTFNWISDVKYSPDGAAIFIADSASSLIRKLENGEVTTFAGSAGSGYRDGALSQARFSNGNGLAFDVNGDLWFSDFNNHLIRKVSDGVMSTVAGIPNPQSNIDGIALKASFKYPGLVAMDKESHRLYIADEYYQNIKVICAAPCYNGGIYNCVYRNCTCPKYWLGPNCTERFTTTSRTRTTKILSSSMSRFQISMTLSAATDDTTEGISSTVIIAAVAGLLAISIFGFVVLIMWKRRKRGLANRHHKSTIINMVPLSVQGSYYSEHTSYKIDMDQTMTQTMSEISNKNRIVSIPGYCLIDIDRDIKINDEAKLGEGGTAVIFKCTFSKVSLISKYGFNEVAVKILKATNQNAIDMIKFEIAIMSSIPPCPNVVQFVGYSDAPLAIAMKYYPISLKDMAKRIQFQKESFVAMKIAFDISTGMAHIHENGVLHLDLKPHNVLIDVHGDGTFNCAICDFGFANFTKESGKQFVSGLEKDNSLGISPRYAAPEMMMGMQVRKTRFDLEIHKKIDVYAFAILLYEVISQKSAWTGLEIEEIAKAVLEGQRPSIDGQENFRLVSPILTEIMQDCWRQNPSDRPPFREIILKIEAYFERRNDSKSVTGSLS